MRLILASRQSHLARVQAYRVGTAIQKKFPEIEVNYHFRESLGDVNQQDPLWKMPEKGVFTEDFVQGLKKGEFDLVVHSWKDLPVENRSPLEIVATMARADRRDVLLLKKTIANKSKLRLLSSSPRRSENLSGLLQDLLPKNLVADSASEPSASPIPIAFEPVRGNITTRLRKLLAATDMDGLILAKAAMDRLLEFRLPKVPPERVNRSESEQEWEDMRQEIREALKGLRIMVLPLSENPTAAAQGALAVEIRSDRSDLRSILLQSLHCEQTFSDVLKERKILKSYGGGCHQAIGVSVARDLLFLKGRTDQKEVLSAKKVEYLEDPTWKKEESFLIKSDQRNERNLYGLSQLRSELDKYRGLYVAKAEAWPEDFIPRADQLVWTAGVTTWKRLAAKGIWVHGSCDSQSWSDPGLEICYGKVEWLKLTHRQAAEKALDLPMLATYELVIKTDKIEIPSNKKVYYWSSAHLFFQAIAEDAQLIDRDHACGLGESYSQIHEYLKKQGKGKVYRFFNEKDWQSHLK